MKVLVTGGAGFIGSHVVDALIKIGMRVIIVDNLSTGFVDNINKMANFYKVNICDTDLEDIFKTEKPNLVFHLAAQTSVARSISDPMDDAKINIMGSLNVINNCIKYGISKIIYSSSCAIYGNPEYLPVDENHPVNPLSPYGISKHTIEHYLSVNNLLKGLSFIALRYSNVYGPRQNPHGEGGVVAIFANKMLSEQQPTIYGSGDKSRDYVFVDDIVRANICAFTSHATGIFNIGTGQETRDQEIYDHISRECRYEKAPIYTPERPGEIKRMYLSNKIAANILKWHPAVNLKDGVSTTVEYYRNQIKPPGK